jgi:hypothetical protein
MKSYITEKFYIKVYYETPNFAIVNAIKVGKGNKVLFVHKEHEPINKKNPRWAISHKSGVVIIYLETHLMERAIKFAENLLKKVNCWFFMGYNQTRRYSWYEYEMGYWKRRLEKVNKCNDAADKLARNMRFNMFT